MKFLILKVLFFYKTYLSPLLGSLLGGSCRFSPTCSEYSYQVIEKYGLMIGGRKSLVRILRCNPFSKPGYDPVI